MNPGLAIAGISAFLVWIMSRFIKPQAAGAPSTSAPAPAPAPAATPPASPAPAGPAPKGSEGVIARLEPVIQSKARALLDASKIEGIELVVTQGLRTMEEQAALYAQGRTAPGPVVTNAKPGSSWHNFGLAFDVAVVQGGKPTWPADEALWQKVGALGKALGLTWGGDFMNFPDRPHCQYTGGLTLEQARAGQRPA
jgi:D-alanyl-D-alanine dipeptidase